MLIDFRLYVEFHKHEKNEYTFCDAINLVNQIASDILTEWLPHTMMM